MLSIFKIEIIRLAVFVPEVKNRPFRVIFKAYFLAFLKRGAAIYFKPPQAFAVYNIRLLIP